MYANCCPVFPARSLENEAKTSDQKKDKQGLELTFANSRVLFGLPLDQYMCSLHGWKERAAKGERTVQVLDAVLMHS